MHGAHAGLPPDSGTTSPTTIQTLFRATRGGVQVREVAQMDVPVTGFLSLLARIIGIIESSRYLL